MPLNLTEKINMDIQTKKFAGAGHKFVPSKIDKKSWPFNAILSQKLPLHMLKNNNNKKFPIPV